MGLVGEARVGKTSVVNRFFEEYFMPDGEMYYGIYLPSVPKTDLIE